MPRVSRDIYPFCLCRPQALTFINAAPVSTASSNAWRRRSRQAAEPRDILAKDVELDVDLRSYFYIPEVCMFKRIRYNGHGKRVIRRVAHRQRNAVDSHAALVNREIPSARHLPVKSVLEREIRAAVSVLHVHALGGHVNMSLHDVAVEAAVHQHRTLNVHPVADLQEAEV